MLNICRFFCFGDYSKYGESSGIWVDYGLVMKPGSQNTAVAAVDAYFGDNENFEGIAIFNDSMINGPSPQTIIWR